MITGILLIAVVSFAATIQSGGKFKNLKVLPQDISEQKLDSIMHAYNDALKVSCEFCHAPEKKNLFSPNPPSKETDFSLDNPMKEQGRKMIRLTMEINEKYFRFDSLTPPAYLNVVSCNTCHRGNPYPASE